MRRTHSLRNDALDGLRLVAVLAVMAFHFGLPDAGGGFLGVDVFFVLSGYLITSMLLTQAQDGRVRVLDFWARRARRLAPGLLPVIVLVVVWSVTVAPTTSRDGLRSDITATLFYVANWHFISTSTYFASDGVASPLRHMWSLAVEEQFYLVWPLLLALITVCVPTQRRRLQAIGLFAFGGAILSILALNQLWDSAGRNRAYLGTDSRIFEPLIGALLATVMTIVGVRSLLGRLHWPLLIAGVAGLLWGVASLGGAGGATGRYAHGGAVIFAGSSAALIAAIATRKSSVTSALAQAPIAYLGRLSYGMYLWHWPLLLWTMRGGWWDLSGLDFIVRVAILTCLTVTLSALSYRFVESPIRYGRIGRALVPRRAAACLAVALCTLFILNSTLVVPHAGAQVGRVTRTIVLVGDSVPQRLAPYLATAAARRGYTVISATRGSCPATGVAVVGASGKPWGAGRACATEVPGRQDGAVRRYHPALVLWWSRYELADRVDAQGRPVAFGSPAYWALQRRAFVERTAALTRYGATIVAVQIERSGRGIRTRCTPSHCGPFLHRLIDATSAQDAWNSFLALHKTGNVRSIGIQALVCHDSASPCDDRLPDGSLARPDGTHYGPDSAGAVASAVVTRTLSVLLRKPPSR